MTTISVLGATALGIVIGWLILYFLRRLKAFSTKVFAALVHIIFGGAIILLFEDDKSILWLYPIGILLGFILYWLIAFHFIHRIKRPKKKDEGIFYHDDK